MRCFEPLSILLGVYIYLGSLTRGELYTSIEELSKWSSIGNKTIELLELSIRLEEDKLAKLYEVQELIQELNSHDGWHKSKDGLESRMHSSINANMEHPIQAFVVLNRFLKAIHLMKSIFDDDEFQQILVDYSLPSSDDLVGCGEALLRLQTFYRLDLEDVIKGNIGRQGESDRPIMGPSECFELGKIAYEVGDYSMAISWLQKSFELYDDDKLIDYDELLEYMAFAAYKNNQIRYAAQLTKLWLEKEPDNERALGNLEYYENELEQNGNKTEESYEMMMADDGTLSAPNNSDIRARQTESFADRYALGATFTANDYDYAKDDIVKYLCRIETNENVDHRNTCTRRILFSIGNHISPELKIEVMNERPKIIRIYDILTDDEAKHLRQMASTRLKRATVQTKQGMVTSDFRVAKTAWLSGQSDEIVHRLEQRIGKVLNIDLHSSEDLQVVNYGVGGFYGPHLDSAREISQPVVAAEEKVIDEAVEGSVQISPLVQNDRLATILIYLNHVEAGGSTVFPKLNLTIKPVERSAVVWYNMMKNGYTDERTLHTGCPVLLGSKWIATKWPREASNTFLRPCGLRSTD